MTLLVHAAQQGDEGAWGEIVDRYTPLVVSVVLRYRLSPTELQDVAQTVWLRLLEHLDDLRDPRALPMWLITTAKREALRSIKTATRTRPTDPQDDAWAARFVVEDDQDADLVRDERHAALLEAFATLTPRQRQLLLILSEDPPVPYAEISRRTGIPVGAIGPTRARAVACDSTDAVRPEARSALGAEPSEEGTTMTERFDDEALALELSELLREAGPHLDEAARRAKGAFTWRTIDEDLLTAELMFDSTQEAEPALTRGTDSGRVMVFSVELKSVEIEVLSDRVVGQFSPESSGQVEVEGGDGVVATVPVDDLGFFVVSPVPSGVVRLRCTTPTTRLVTDWVRL